MKSTHNPPPVYFFPQTGWRLALDRAPLFLSVLLLFFLPFITQVEGADSIYPKQALTEMLVFLILGAWALKAFLTGKVVWIQTTAFWPLMALLAWILVTLVLSPYPAAGWSALEEWVCFPLWYLLLTLTCIEAWRSENLLFTFLVASLGTGLWAVAQAFGLGGGVWLDIVNTQFGGRVTAGMGNPDFLAGYLVLVLPIAWAIETRAVQWVTRLLWGLLILVAFLGIAWAGSLAGALGMSVALVVFTYFDYPIHSKRPLWNWLLLSMFMLMVLSVLFIFADDMMKLLPGPHDKSIQFRKEVWKGVVTMIKDRPLTGVGFGAFSAAFPAYRPQSLMMWQVQRSYEVNHAHNWILEWTAETGMVGLFLLLAFWFYVLSQWWRLYAANAVPRALGAGVFAAFSGVAVDNLFDINSYLASTLIPLLLLAALPVALSQRFFHLEGFPVRYKEVDFSKFKIYLLPVVVLVVFLAFQQVGKAFQRQFADVRLKKAMVLSEGKKWDEAITAYDQALKLNPQNLMAKYFQGSTYADRWKEGDGEKALEYFNAVGKVQPDYVLLHFKKAKVLSRLNRAEVSKVEMKRAIQLDSALIFQMDEYKEARKLVESKLFSAALAIYQKLVLDYPTCVPALVDYANCLVMDGRNSEATAAYRQALTFDPENKEALTNLKQLNSIPK